jgi:predicted metalloprotease
MSSPSVCSLRCRCFLNVAIRVLKTLWVYFAVELFAVVRSDLETYRRGRFQAMSLPYRPISAMRFFNRSAFSGCGRADDSGPFYCGRDVTVYLDEAFMNERVARIGDFAGAVIIAYEIGHHIQYLLGLLDQPSITKELQADCLAGAWLSRPGGLCKRRFPTRRDLPQQR